MYAYLFMFRIKNVDGLPNNLSKLNLVKYNAWLYDLLHFTKLNLNVKSKKRLYEKNYYCTLGIFLVFVKLYPWSNLFIFGA